MLHLREVSKVAVKKNCFYFTVWTFSIFDKKNPQVIGHYLATVQKQFKVEILDLFCVKNRLKIF